MRSIFRSLLVSLVLSFSLSSVAFAQSIRSVLGGEAKSAFEPSSEVNVRNKEAIQLVQIAGRAAVRLRLDYSWQGGNLDWYRLGREQPGHAQRLQFRESSRATMKPGREYWYSASFLLPSSVRTVSNHTLSMMDFKHVMFRGSVPTVELEFSKGRFRIKESLDSRWRCGTYRNVDGGQTAVCDRTNIVASLGGQSQFADRWVQVVAQMKWSTDDTGFFNLWIDGRPIYGFSGNSLQQAEGVQFKFGPYRHHMNGDPGVAEIYYAGIVRAKSCEGLGISNCDALFSRPPRPGFQNIQSTERQLANEFSEGLSR